MSDLGGTRERDFTLGLNSDNGAGMIWSRSSGEGNGRDPLPFLLSLFLGLRIEEMEPS